MGGGESTGHWRRQASTRWAAVVAGGARAWRTRAARAPHQHRCRAERTRGERRVLPAAPLRIQAPEVLNSEHFYNCLNISPKGGQELTGKE